MIFDTFIGDKRTADWVVDFWPVFVAALERVLLQRLSARRWP